MTASLAYAKGPLAGLPLRGPALPEAANAPGPHPLMSDVVRAARAMAEATEATVSARIAAITTAAGALDRLECQPFASKQAGLPYQPMVAVMDREALVLLVPADMARRLAVIQSELGRGGAALDLMQGADQAEEISRLLQKGMH